MSRFIVKPHWKFPPKKEIKLSAEVIETAKDKIKQCSRLHNDIRRSKFELDLYSRMIRTRKLFIRSAESEAAKKKIKFSTASLRSGLKDLVESYRAELHYYEALRMAYHEEYVGLKKTIDAQRYMPGTQ